MDNTQNLALPYIVAAQAQKHITHNEALHTLDMVVQIGVHDKDLTLAPVNPADGDRYIIPQNATGDWQEFDGKIAAFTDNHWVFYTPRMGWLAYVADENSLYLYNGYDWVIYSSANVGNETSNIGGLSTVFNKSVHAAQTRFELIEEELSLLGSTVDSTINIPTRAIVFGVSTRTTEAITDASSYDCGIAGDTQKYGGTLGIALGSTNSGVTGPTAFYSNTPIRITANGNNFGSGKVRITIHYMVCDVPTT